MRGLETGKASPEKRRDNKTERHRSKYLSVVFWISFFAVLFLYGLAKNVRGEVKERDSDIRAASDGVALTGEVFSEEKEYEKKTREKFDELGKNINELEAKAMQSGTKTKAHVTNEIDKLRAKRAVLQINMEKLAASQKGNWETAKQKVDAAMDELEKAYHKARSHFESE